MSEVINTEIVGRGVVTRIVNPSAVRTTISSPRIVTTILGVPGQSGADGTGDSHYTHTQTVPSATWTIMHNLNKYPSVSVVDSAGTLVVGDVTYDSENALTVSFTASFGGKAYLN